MCRINHLSVARENASKNRDQLTIMAHILEAIRIKKSRKKTQIMQSANLSTSLADKYLNLLMRNGYVILEDGNVYKVTKKGSYFLQSFIYTEYVRGLHFKR